MTRHEQFAEEAVSFALGELNGEERAAFQEHLNECASCRRELSEVQEAIAAFALTAVGPAPPPARSRERLLQAIQTPPSPRPPFKISRISRPQWMFVPALASVFLAIVAIVLVGDNFHLRDQLTAANASSKLLEARLAHAEMIAEAVTAPDSVRISLVSSKTKPQPECKVFYLRRKNAIVFMASNLAPPPPSKTYELWAIAPGAAPVPAGTFSPDSNGGATMFMEMPMPGNGSAKTFAITMEPVGGSPQPTSTPMMAGSLS